MWNVEILFNHVFTNLIYVVKSYVLKCISIVLRIELLKKLSNLIK